MKSSDQQPRTCKNPIAAEVCKCVCVCAWVIGVTGEGKEKEEGGKGYIGTVMGLRVKKESCLVWKVLSCVCSINF